jgi:hypothetical protein
VSPVLEAHPPLSAEQRLAVQWITQGSRLAVIEE